MKTTRHLLALLALVLVPKVVSATTALKVTDVTGTAVEYKLEEIRSITVQDGQFKINGTQKDAVLGTHTLTGIRSITFSPVLVGLVTQQQLDKQRVFSWKDATTLYMTCLSSKPGTMTMDIYSANGQKVYSATAALSVGEQTFTAPIGDLAPGAYVCRLRDAQGKKYALKFVR